MKRATKSLMVTPLAAAAYLLWPGGASAQVAPALTDVEVNAMELGKRLFFDTRLSVPSGQACASCHDPARGWTFPDSAVNEGQVAAPGTAFGKNGNIKPPSAAYAFFSPPFQPFTPPPGAPIPPWEGGNFWDGRAEGYGAPDSQGGPQGTGAVSETITVADLGVAAADLSKYLGPTADQALNPMPNPVEQNIFRRNVCLVVRASYNDLYAQVFGEPVNCRTRPGGQGNRPYDLAFKRFALAMAAYEASDEVNSFSSLRDIALDAAPIREFPIDFTPYLPDSLTEGEKQARSDFINLGHDLFYGRNDSGLNGGIDENGNPIDPDNGAKNAACTACHRGVPEGDAPDPDGVAPRQLYTDNLYHNIGVPFNKEIPGVESGQVTGLSDHVISVDPGEFRTPTLRNVALGASDSFTKAYAHNGYFKSLDNIVHFYNTAAADGVPCANSNLDLGNGCIAVPFPPFEVAKQHSVTRCEPRSEGWTDSEAIAANCWPEPEFDEPGLAIPFVVGNLGLTSDEEDALVAYLESLSDQEVAEPPADQ